MMKKFYGFENTYGIDARDTDNERIGCVVVFCSRADRDEWVSKGKLRNGNYCHEAITAKEARREMVRVAYDYMINEHVVWERADLRYLPMDTITEAYAQVMK
jgi:hypothetical protein